MGMSQNEQNCQVQIQALSPKSKELQATTLPTHISQTQA